MQRLQVRLTALCLLLRSSHGFVTPHRPSTRSHVDRTIKSSLATTTRIYMNNEDSNKFGMAQRVDSAKSGILGAIVGSIAQAPVTFALDILNVGSPVGGGLAQWEFDTDAAAVSSALFAIVYRYCIRTDDNPQLNQGVIGAFVLVRTLSKITIPGYCSAVPLNCGAPLGYLDWNLIQQLGILFVESGLMFGATALALDFAMEKGYISKFP